MSEEIYKGPRAQEAWELSRMLEIRNMIQQEPKVALAYMLKAEDDFWKLMFECGYRSSGKEMSN